MIELYNTPHFWSMYWAAAFLHALVFIKVHGGADTPFAAFWMTAGLTFLFPIFGVVTLWDIVAVILFFVLNPTPVVNKRSPIPEEGFFWASETPSK